ncbi:MAG: tRNA 2-thiocytidine(32) synthetase TtcA [Desulfuromonadales bacterium]|nr:tRNA 2-thiocytidine(32) synthetase TtcA [Desulfuromonadales bacterium]
MDKIKEKLHRRIKRSCGKAIGDFNLIDDGDRIAVAVSGGKDSWTLLHILNDLRQRAPVRFELIAVNFDPGFAGYRSDLLADYLQRHNFTYHIEKTASSAVIAEKLRPGSSYCAFCSRLRRGVLYSVAQRLDCNKLALGHHLDDFIETLLLNQFYAGKLAAMSAKLLADNGLQTVIRPLVYVEEELISNYSTRCNFPIISCACPLAGEQEHLQQRQRMKRLIRELSSEIPQIRHSLLSAMGNIHHRHLLG